VRKLPVEAHANADYCCGVKPTSMISQPDQRCAARE